MKIFLIVLSFVFALPTQVFAEAYVSNEARIEILKTEMKVKARQYQRVFLNTMIGDRLEINIGVYNKKYKDVSAYICTQTDLQMFHNKLQNNCRGINKGIDRYKFDYRVQSNQPHYLVINNRYSIIVAKKVRAVVMATRHVSGDIRQRLETAFRQFNVEILKRFKVQPFDFFVKPCGRKNAFSERRTGNITLCSELFFELARQKKTGTIMGITYHELGHTLPNLWGLPNFDNEEAADEFALVMMFYEGAQEQALDWITFFENRNSQGEAVNMIRHGDRHPLSVQRIRNVKRILRNPRPVIERWNRLLYPRMTKYGLEQLRKMSPKYMDQKLANKVLTER